MANPFDSVSPARIPPAVSQGCISERNKKIGGSVASFVMAVALLVLAVIASVGAFGSGNMFYFLGGALTSASIPFFILGIVLACKTPKNTVVEVKIDTTSQFGK